MPKKLTQEEFQRYAKDKFPTHDFTDTTYVNAHTHVEGLCLIHEEKFLCKYNDMKSTKSGNMCPKCGQEARVKNKDIDKWQTSFKKTMVERYGVEYALQNEEIAAKALATNKENHGGVHYSQQAHVKEQYSKRELMKYRVHFTDEQNETFHNPENLAQMNIKKGLNLSEIGDVYGVGKDLVQKHFARLGLTPIRNKRSMFEKDMCDFLDSLNVEYEISDRKLLKGKELDIYIPSHNLAIELNGVWWHSVDCLGKEKARSIHKNKTDMCDDLGIHLIHIWEDTWKHKEKVVKNFLKNKLGFTDLKKDARKLKLRKASIDEVYKFFNDNHLQGCPKMGTVYVLSDSDTIYAGMIFKSLNDNEYEIIRYATCGNIRGGFSKLMKGFIREYSPKKIHSFADRETVYKHNNVYSLNGFNALSEIPPDYKYYDQKLQMRKHKFLYRKKYFESLGYEVDHQTEEQLRIQEKLYKCYDAGKIRYVYVV